MSSFDVTDPCVSQPAQIRAGMSKKHKGGDERAVANTKKAMLEGMASKDAKEAAAFAESMAAVDRLIEGKLQGAKPAKLRIQKRSGSLQLQFSDPDLVLASPTSLTINGCAETLEGLQTRLYTTEEPGTWIHGADCFAKILKCESHVHEKHATTGVGNDTVIGEVHYTGPCTVNFAWAPTGAEPSIVIEVSTSYAKFMWSLPT